MVRLQLYSLRVHLCSLAPVLILVMSVVMSLGSANRTPNERSDEVPLCVFYFATWYRKQSVPLLQIKLKLGGLIYTKHSTTGCWHMLNDGLFDYVPERPSAVQWLHVSSSRTVLRRNRTKYAQKTIASVYHIIASPELEAASQNKLFLFCVNVFSPDVHTRILTFPKFDSSRLMRIGVIPFPVACGTIAMIQYDYLGFAPSATKVAILLDALCTCVMKLFILLLNVLKWRLDSEPCTPLHILFNLSYKRITLNVFFVAEKTLKAMLWHVLPLNAKAPSRFTKGRLNESWSWGKMGRGDAF